MRHIIMAVALCVLAGGSLLQAGETDSAYIGRVDTIGGTIYDWQMCGPSHRMIVNAPGHGVHAAWLFSASMSGTTFPDRNMGYNYYDYATGEWSWIDPDHMASGVNVYTERCGYGNLDVDPETGVGLISAHYGSPLRFGVARDLVPGGGVFEYCDGPEGFMWPAIAVGSNGWIHAAAFDATRNRLFYTRCTTWCHWEPPSHIPPPEPDPGFPGQHITASKVSLRVVVTWTNSTGNPDPGYYCESTDGGTTWLPPQELPWPPAFGGDTLPSYYISGLFPHYDRRDRFHIVAAITPFVGGQGWMMPIELWHWCRENDPRWSRIHRAGCDTANLRGGVGYNALYAGRPSIGEDRSGGLYVAWEQFDSLNLEPQTEYLRADIFYARDNYNNGASWREAVRITEPDSSSKRFPSVIDFLSRDTLCILYMIDEVAGFFVQEEGPATHNPIVVQFVPVVVPGIAERGTPAALRITPEMHPTLVRGMLRLPESSRYSTSALLNSMGRKVMDLQPGANDIRCLAPGVYFLQPGKGKSAKVVIQR